MALGVLLILFVVMSAVSVLGISLLFLVKSSQPKKFIFYCLCFWGMAIAVVGATSLPTNYVFQKIVAWGLGFLSVGGLLIYIQDKEEKLRSVAYAMVIISIIAGLQQIFF